MGHFRNPFDLTVRGIANLVNDVTRGADPDVIRYKDAVISFSKADQWWRIQRETDSPDALPSWAPTAAEAKAVVDYRIDEEMAARIESQARAAYHIEEYDLGTDR